MKPLQVALLVPYFSGSHRQWAMGWQQYSRHQITLMTLSGSHWKWRMQGGAITLARRWNELSFSPDCIVATDMLHVPLFLSLTRTTSAHLPLALYFHENQLAYPVSPTDTDLTLHRDRHYAFINYTSALAANELWFNSEYNRNSFVEGLPSFLSAYPDHQELSLIDTLRPKSWKLPIGLDIPSPAHHAPRTGPPVLGWNHRWEHDKNPEAFYRLLCALQAGGITFRLVLLGEEGRSKHALYRQIQAEFADKILHAGYAPDRPTYLQRLAQCDFLPVTSRHDFFGISVCEAIACNVHPLLPNNLAYPEHIPVEQHPNYLYESEAELTTQLMDRCRQVEIWRTKTIAHWVAQYDWQVVAPAYDAAIDSLVTR